MTGPMSDEGKNKMIYIYIKHVFFIPLFNMANIFTKMSDKFHVLIQGAHWFLYLSLEVYLSQKSGLTTILQKLVTKESCTLTGQKMLEQ